MAELVVWFPLTVAGSTSIASTGTYLTWYWVLSDLSSTTGMVLGTNIDLLIVQNRQKIEKYEKMLRGTILILQKRQKIETYEKMFRRPILNGTK